MSAPRISRLIELIRLLQVGRGHNAESLAVACGVSRRTIFRDLETLRRAGVPVTYSEDRQSYSLTGGPLLPPPGFSIEEAMALVVLTSELGDDNGVPFQAPARRAALKLEASLPPRWQEQLRAMVGVVEIRLPRQADLAERADVFNQLFRLAAARRCARIEYQSPAEAELIHTKLSPYRLLFSRRTWYVIGRSSIHRATRTFHIGRILQLEPLDDSFTVPRGFSIRRYLRNAWHLIPEKGADRRVVVRFEKLVAQNVAEVSWHATQRLVFLPDGRLDFHVTVSGLNEISWWILGYGDQAEVLRPAELRKLVEARTRRMLSRYDSSGAARPKKPGSKPRRAKRLGR